MSVSPTTSPRRSRNWLWFFGVLVLLAITALSLQLWYKFRQQLRSEDLTSARQRWQEKGPASYRAEYLVKRLGEADQHYIVVVEEGRITAVRRTLGQPLEPGTYQFDKVESLFDHIDKQLETDAQTSSPRVFATAIFDPTDGHVLRYVRSTRSPRERLEVIQQIRPPEDRR